MARQVRIIDVFLSSPSDLDFERNLVKRAAHDWNVLRGAATGCHINILTWEDAVAPALSDRPQAVINEAIGDEYDVFLGMMWGRFGSPTGVAESGTVEEFDRALDRYRRGDALRLAMIFKTAPIPQSNLSGEQFDRVQAFKKRFADEGGLYREFADEDSLRKIISRILEDIAAAHGSLGGSESATSQPDGTLSASDRQEGTQPEAAAGDRAGPYQDMGLFELNEKIEEVVEAQTDFLEEMTNINRIHTLAIDQANSEMQALASFGNANQTTLRKPIGAITKSMNELATFLERNVPDFKARDDELIDLTAVALDISKDFAESEDGADSLRSAVLGLIATMSQNRDSLRDLIGTVRASPRMTTDYNKAKKRLSAIQEVLLAEYERLVNDLDAALKKDAI